MTNKNLDEYRSPLDFFHFTIASLGFLIAGGGIIVASVRVALLGLIMFAWGFAYFCAQPD